MRKLRIVSSARDQHRAYYGDQLLVPDQLSEISLVLELGNHEVDLKQWECIESYGSDFPFTWVWEKRS